MTVRMGGSLYKTQQYVCANAYKITIPQFISSGSADQTVSSIGIQEVAQTTNVYTMQIYKDAKHCLHQELPETTKQYLLDLKEWICKKVLLHSI